VFLFHTAYVLYYCEHGGVDPVALKPDLRTFSALVGLFDP